MAPHPLPLPLTEVARPTRAAARLLALAIWVGSGCTTKGEPRDRTPGGGAGGVGTSTSGSGTGTDSGTDTAISTSDLVDASGLGEGDFYIFPYEAVLAGDGKATFGTGRVPAVSIDYDGAKAACESAGFRLCTLDEWIAACKGPKQNLYAISATLPTDIEELCDVARTSNTEPGSLPSNTGSHPRCKTEDLDLYDMIGNVSEWVVNSGATPVAAGVAFYQALDQSQCEATLTGSGSVMDPAEKSTDLGFRCCKDK